MNTIFQIYINALLADATYALGDLTGLEPQQLKEIARIDQKSIFTKDSK